jgi:hypothetical protein
MRRKDLLWVLAYPIYQVIGTFRHEAGHALAAIAFGGVIEEFVFLPTKGYWGYVRWEGPDNLFTFGAPYLLDLLTFLIFFTVCMQLTFRRRWVWLNLVIIGVVSPLINSAYNYRQTPGRVNDVTVLLRDGNETMVHIYFTLTLSLYIAGLYILFTRAKIYLHQPPVSRAWTAVPLVLGATMLISACSSTLWSSVEPQSQQPVEPSTPAPKPTPLIRSATMTATEDPVSDYYKVYEQVIGMLNSEFPLRGPEKELEWSADVDLIEKEDNLVLVDANFVSGEWHIRLFDWDFQDRSDLMDVSVWNKQTKFVWRGYAGSGELIGWLTSGGFVPEIMESAGLDGWFTYANHQYGYRFKYPAEADVFEFGVETFDLNDVPAGMTADEYQDYLYETNGPNLCVKLNLGDGYIYFEAPENWEGNYTFCRKLGPGAPGWSVPVRQEVIDMDGQVFTFDGREFIKIDGTGNDHDEALAYKLPSGVRIEFGAYSDADGGYDQYRAEVLPILIRILETYETIPRASNP